MPKRKRPPPFHVYGTADYFRDRDRLFTHGQHTIDVKVAKKDAALDMAYGFMLNNEPKGPNAYVLIEKVTSRGRERIGGWNSDNWGQMSPNRGRAMRRNAEVDEQDIKWAIESVLETMADEGEAESHSYLDDQTLMDLDELGYDSSEPYMIAEFGDAAGVNGELLVHEFWYKELDLKPPSRVVDTWGEASTKGKHSRRASYALVGWLLKKGYERVDRLGGAWPVGDERELDEEQVAQRVADELEGVSVADVAAVLEEEFGGGSGVVYWSGHSGDIEMYAIPLEEEE